MRLGLTARSTARGAAASSSLALLLTACALPQPQPAAPISLEEIPALQRTFARDSSDVAVRLRLAEAQRRAGQTAIAARLLEPVSDGTPVAAFYLALVREDQGRAADARQLYQRYLARQSRGELSDRVRDRLTLLDRLELQQAVRSALAAERELSTRPAVAGVVGVFPFLMSTSDPQLRPLATAFAELLSSDLGHTSRLRVVERARVKQLLDEIRLSESRRVEPATAVRGGRLLGAGTLVQGRIDGSATDLDVQAAVVRVQTPATAANVLRARNALSRVFDVEKSVALGVYQRMGIQLTSGERDRVMHHETRNVQALLELGFGLESQDAGRYAEAAEHFTRAAQLDPNFALAARYASAAAVRARAAAFSTTTLAELALAQLPARRVEAVRPVDMFEAIERLVPNPSVRDASTEALGVEGFVRSAPADLVITRP
jgi:tetratricopeptide (TPR) repeat protein